eukprot:270734_1
MNKNLVLILLVAILLISGNISQTDEYVSILGDPGLTFAPNGPRVMIEAWNYCSNAGPHFVGDPPLPSPRYADCVGLSSNNCTFGPYNNNCVPESLNNAQPSNTSNPYECDQFAIQKEQKLGTKCRVNDTYFWSTMLQNGNYILSSNLCPDQNWGNNLPMNQPRILHQYTDNTYHGYFEGTWDINVSINMINITNNISYFKLEWEYNKTSRNAIFRNTIKTSQYYPWLMLYTGVDVAKGEKGNVAYSGRGLMKYTPSTSTDFVVQFRLSLNTAYQAGPHSSFYFLNMCSCWKDNNIACDGNTTTDVTRNILMETNPEYHQACNVNNTMACPRYHTFINGTIVDRNNTNSFPYDAYKEWCAPYNCDDLLPGEVRCDHSNPMAQSIMKIAPHSEWEPHGFPAKSGDGYVGDNRFWTLHVGQLLKRMYFSCTNKDVPTQWETFNIGPEAGIGVWNGYSILYEWDISEFDVRVPT